MSGFDHSDFQNSVRKAHRMLPRTAYSLRRHWLEATAFMGIIALFLYFPFVLFYPRLSVQDKPDITSEEQLIALGEARDVLKKNLVLNNAQALGEIAPIKPRQIDTCIVNRASLVDRSGRVLATSVDGKYEFVINPQLYRLTSEIEIIDLAQKLHGIVPSKPASMYAAALRGNSRKVVGVDLSPEQARAIRALEGRFSPSLRLSSTQGRIYPEGELFAHSIGYLGDDHCAKTGLEKVFASQTGAQNEDIVLSLDSDLQSIAAVELQRALEASHAEKGYTIVMNIHTGEILAEVVLPTFDPHKRNFLFNNHPEHWKKVSYNAIHRPVELGSLLKIQNTAMALESGIRMHDVWDTTTQLVTNRKRIREPFKPKFDYDVVSILMKSSNWGSARIALHLGRQKQNAFLQRMGLSSADKLAEDMSDSRTANMSFGYGLMLSYRKHMVSTAALLNGGYKIKPTYQRVDEPHRYIGRVYDAALSHQLGRLLLTNVVHEEGTGRNAYHPGVMLGGKTGTAKIMNADNTAYIKDTRASFLGVFPAHQPKYMIMSSLVRPVNQDSEPLNSGVATAPVVGNIAQRMAAHLGELYSVQDVQRLEQQFVYRTQFDEIRVAQN